MPTKENFEIDTPSPAEMKDLIASLSPSERAILRDPNFITEDEADIIVTQRTMNELEPTITFDELLRQEGRVRKRPTREKSQA